MNQAKLLIGALWTVAYSLLAWTLVSINQVQQDIAGIRTSLTRMERDAGDFVTRRELDLRGAELRRRIEALEKRP